MPSPQEDPIPGIKLPLWIERMLLAALKAALAVLFSQMRRKDP